MEIKNPITVVIATLGGGSLASTLESLNSGTVVPSEILVCIPIEDAWRVADLRYANVRVLKTDFRGQVAQRIWGFQNALSELVMQIDDDILVAPDCMKHLVETLLSLGPKVALSPALIDLDTGGSVYRKPQRSGALLSFYYWLMNGSDGYSPGQIDKSGSSVGVDPSLSDDRLYDVEWLAGGCVLHFRENLVLENFWPLPGKAYYEDVVHSCLLRAKGIRLVIDVKARCSLELFNQSSFRTGEFVRNLYQDYLGRKYFMRRFSRQSPRMYLYYLGRVISYAFLRR
jgi:glycosyltransferase involved in cell wall biosynthesis